MNSKFKLALFYCSIGLCFGLNLKELTEIKLEYNFYEEAFTFKRIITNITLKNIFPTLSKNHTYEIEFDRSTSLPKLDYSLVYENSEIYFLTSLKKVANLKVNFILNTNLLNEFEFNKEVSVNYKVKELEYSVNYVFEFTVLNTTLSNLYKSEDKILSYFRNNLWRKQVLFYSVQNGNLDITYIKAGNKSNSFVIGVGSDYGQSEKLGNLIQLKHENPSTCFSIKNDDLKDFKESTGLNVDLCSFVLNYINHDEFENESNYIVNVYYNLQIDDLAVTANNAKMIFASVSIATLFILIILSFSAYKCIKNYSIDLAYKKGSV